MPTTYRQLFDRVYSKIKDCALAELAEETADAIIEDCLSPAAAAFESCSQDLSDRSDREKTFNFDLDETNLEILSNFMVIEYIDSNFIRTSLMLRAYMSSTDFHKYDNKDMLGKAAEVRAMYLKENRRLMINRSVRSDGTLKELFERHGAYSPEKRRRRRH